VTRALSALALVLALAAPGACRREDRTFDEQPPRPPLQATPLTDFHAGGAPLPASPQSPFRGNAFGLSEGKRLFSEMNCVGCHAHGGGGIGPALMDAQWIYGSRPDQIFATILEGRPNGMPSFQGQLTDQQVWQIVAYIESLGAQVPRDAAPARDDDMSTGKPELRLDERPAVQTGHR
jgi:cytochrome c oxidase cbb3-type subunit 3